MDRASRQRVAWHEAGHAVVAAACGFEPTRCDILPGPDRRGHFDHRELTEDEQAAYEANDPALLVRLLLITVGGVAGEYLLSQHLGRQWKLDGWAKDRLTAVDLLSRLKRDAQKDIFRYIGASAEMLKEPRRQECLEALAVALETQLELSPDTLLSLCASVPALKLPTSVRALRR